MKLAAIYARVSTVNHGQDTKRQVEELKSYAKLKGYDVKEEDIYQDYISGYSKIGAREQLNKLRDEVKCESGSKYEAIFITEISRLARDPIVGRDLVNFFTQNNVCLYVKTPELESIPKNKESIPLFSIIFTILAEFANAEALQTKQRQKSGIRSKAEKGGFIGGAYINYGYKNVEKNIVVDDFEADIVKKIFDLCNSGSGTKKIAKYLNEHGIQTRVSGKSKVKLIKQKNGLPPVYSDQIIWKDGTVYGLLTNSIYYGKKKYKLDSLSPVDLEIIEKSGESHFYVDVPPIIEKAVFDKAQSELASRLKHSIRNTKFKYILKDVLKCGICGGNYCGKRRSDGSDSYYFCRTRETKTRDCDNLGIDIELIESAVWTAIVDSSFVEQMLLKQSFNIEEVEKEKVAASNAIEQFKVEIELLNRSKERWILLYTNLEIEKMHFENGTKPIISNISKLKNKVIENSNRLLTLDNLIESKKSMENLVRIKNSLGADRLKIQQIIKESFQRVSLIVLDRKNAVFSIVLKSNLNEEVSFLLNRKEKFLVGFNFNEEFFTPQGLLSWDKYGRLLTNFSDLVSNIHHLTFFYEDLSARKDLIWIRFQ